MVNADRSLSMQTRCTQRLSFGLRYGSVAELRQPFGSAPASESKICPTFAEYEIEEFLAF
jgi:hypothetical protein